MFFLSSYSPTIVPELLTPPGSVASAPGTLTSVNLKVKVGAAAAVAAIRDADTNPRNSNNDLQVFIVFPRKRLHGTAEGCFLDVAAAVIVHRLYPPATR